MKTKFEMGPVQKAWVKSLREHPERQAKGYLGDGTPDDYKACCLGELLVRASGFNLCPSPFVNGRILDGGDPDGSSRILRTFYKKVGLHSDQGSIIYSLTSLGEMNDNGVTWPKIADFIEANPEKVFSKSV
jgi:hypothetical protein